MSGIFGIFNRNGKPVSSEILLTMYDAMAYWGPDGGSTWHDGPVGLGQLILYNTPEALHERLPRVVGGGIVLTAEARIDNRTELSDFFDIPHTERPKTPDSDLIQYAYQKWGQDCTNHLVGDWSFAVWNPAEETLFLARDHHGNTALYYYLDKRIFAFASSRKALFAIGIHRQLNEIYLGQLLISWPAYHGPDTIDLDVHRLPPAHHLSVTPERVDIQRYWRLEDTPELRLPSLDEYLEGLMELYTEAVRCRLRSYRPIGATLSGGLDSGSMTALAARELKTQGQLLPTFTSVPVYDTSATVGPKRFGDETYLARATADFVGNVDPHFLKSEQINPVSAIRHVLEIHDEPGRNPTNDFWGQDLLSTVHKCGIGTLLTGQGGNATISWKGAPGLRSALGAFRHKGWKAAAKHLLPGALLRLYMGFQIDKVTWERSPIHPVFAQRMGLAQLGTSKK